MKRDTALKIEQITKKILFDENIIAPPISSERIADLYYDLSFDKRNLDKYSNNGIVWAAIDIKHKVICFNSSKMDELDNNLGLKNFTIAHEVGHWALHRNEILDKLPDFDSEVIICRGENVYDERERQANYFAANLLMPEDFVKTAFEDVSQVFYYGTLCDLAEQFNVSKQAMKIRLEELHLAYTKDMITFYRSKLEMAEVLGGQQKLF